MPASLIDGKAIAREIEAEVTAAISRLSFAPGLVAVRVGNDPASEIYVRSKAKKAQELGLRGSERVFPETMSEGELLAEVDRLNRDDEVDGILVQLPLPKQIDPQKIIDAIAPEKDVDGFHPVNVGKPMAALLLQRNATVTICHSRTQDLQRHTLDADVLVAAVGRTHLVSADMVKAGATVIDVGMNRDESSRKVLGDVDPGAMERAAYMTPVPGGVGPMTIAMVLQNAVTAARLRSSGAIATGKN